MQINWWLVLVALLPFLALIAGFLIWHMDALVLSIAVFVLEAFLAIFVFHLSLLHVLESSLWGQIVMWTGFLVLWTGQVFGQSFQTTGLMPVLLNLLQRVLPSREGKALTLSSIVGGLIGAFNGFATYPVTIPGLASMGMDGARAAVAYLVYFSWSIPFVSMYLAPNIASVASGVPVYQIARVAGLLSIPGVVLCTYAFFHIAGYDVRRPRNMLLLVLNSVGNIAALLIFTQWLYHYYILVLIAGSVFTLALIYAFREPLSRGAEGEVTKAAFPLSAELRSVAPLALGVAVVLLWTVPSILNWLKHLQFTVAWFGQAPITINLFTSAGFYIFVTAASCYLFTLKHPMSFSHDIRVATKRNLPALGTLFFGSAMVYQMVDAGQLTLLAHALSQWGASAYAGMLSVLSFLAGMAFGQGLPADLMFAKMQVAAAKDLGASLAVLVSVVVLLTMGPSNPLKPTQIKYAGGLAQVSGQDSRLFRSALPWQLAQMVIIGVLAILILPIWR